MITVKRQFKVIGSIMDDNGTLAAEVRRLPALLRRRLGRAQGVQSRLPRVGLIGSQVGERHRQQRSELNAELAAAAHAVRRGTS